MTLYAFNLEIARVRESVREPMAGMIRLQWWREMLATVDEDGDADRHPVAAPLLDLVRAHALPLELFEALLASRERDLDPDGPADLEAAETYAADSSGALSQLAMLALGVGEEEALRAARHVGIAWALLGQARAVGFHLSIGRLTLPEALLRLAGSSGGAVMSGQAPRAAITQAVRAMAQLADGHLKKARRLRVPRAGLAAVLPAVLADGHLSALRSCGWDPFHPKLALARHRPLALAFSHWRGRF
ncbi:phytoene/squalene synthetase [Paramagnetospirillum marisnigri]|uniref:Phytoene/squalene synthetase n=2 Tax=Paramagnetospirillum marisnigri TaxID=1285242 RepID=A0A178M781_9PROT|nr:phytoene/squalene synthetase [Paramagnetospirillum marisnigri]